MVFAISTPKKTLMTIIIFFLSILKIKSQVMPLETYDACAYVGASNQPDLADFCLETDPNCCYFAFEWGEQYVYYACINKVRLIDSVGKTNLTAAFLYESSDEVYPILNNIVYVKCSESKGVIVSPSKMEPPSLDTNQRRRRILTYKSFEEFVEDNDTRDNSFFYEIGRLFKNVLKWVLKCIKYFVSFLSSYFKNNLSQ